MANKRTLLMIAALMLAVTTGLLGIAFWLWSRL